MQIAHILATGDEIRTGALVDSNSAHIADALESIGVQVDRHVSVGDDLDDLVGLFQETGRRADIAVVTGGLGPTSDDRTAEAAARAGDVSLSIDSRALASVEAFFKHFGRPMTEANRKQAFLPDGAECLPNPVGTAPGFALDIGRCRFFFLPGVPGEMRRMLADHVLPAVRLRLGSSLWKNEVRTLGVFGFTESGVNRRLAGFEAAFPELVLGFRASFPVIQVKLYAAGDDPDARRQGLDAATAWVGDRLGDRLFSTDNTASMAVTVGQLLTARGMTLAVAESCTGGLIANLVTDVAGSSRYFVFGAVTYANAAKTNVLGVDEALIATHGAVHEKVAEAMAIGARETGAADIAVATSGIAGPDGGTPEKPVGTVCIGIATARRAFGLRLTFPFKDRNKNKRMFAETALDLVRRELFNLPSILRGD